MRFELTLHEETLGQTIDLLRQHEIAAISVTAHTVGMEILPRLERVLKELPELDVMLHVATKHHDEASFRAHLAAAHGVGVTSFLVVSGHPQRDFDTLHALEAIKAEGYRVWVAYNPFAYGVDLEIEQLRLFHKLAYQQVCGVAFQIGHDHQAIIDAVELLEGRRPGIEIMGDVLIPNELVRERFATQPLPGVALSDEFVRDAAYAQAETEALLRLYKQLGVQTLIDIIPFQQEHVAEFLQTY